MMAVQRLTDIRHELEYRCIAARHGRLRPYSGMIRANTLAALQSTFPRFCEYRGAAALANDVDLFWQEFGAQQAAFIRLPGEFLRFFQCRRNEPFAQVLIELEWTLFLVQTDATIVQPFGLQAAPGNVVLNPTARLVVLPFELDSDWIPTAVPVCTQTPRFLHAIYRTADHRVITHPLSSADVDALLACEQSSDSEYRPGAFEWQDKALRRGLLTINASND